MARLRYKHKIADAYELDETMSQYFEATRRLATQLLMHAQMVLPQQRWVQQTLAVSRVAALLVNELWSHEDDECKRRMKDILAPPDKPAEEGMPFPELSMKARTVLAMALDAGIAGTLEATSEPVQCLPSQLVAVELQLTAMSELLCPPPSVRLLLLAGLGNAFFQQATGVEVSLTRLLDESAVVAVYQRMPAALTPTAPQ